MKRIGTIFICFFLIYAGVAWAMEACLHQKDHADHAASFKSEPRASDYSLSNHFNSPHHPAPNLHCLDLDHQIGPMAQVSSVSRLVPFTGSVLLKESPFSGSVAPGATNALWLRALFEKFLSFSFLSGISYHLFLSVLRI